MKPALEKSLRWAAISSGSLMLCILLVLAFTDWSPLTQSGVEQISATRPMRLADGKVD
jgi:hypothetical protein